MRSMRMRANRPSDVMAGCNLNWDCVDDRLSRIGLVFAQMRDSVRDRNVNAIERYVWELREHLKAMKELVK